MKLLFTLAVAAFFCGCICCGRDVSLPPLPGSGGGALCDKPYIHVGGECCIDSDDNSICDVDEAADDADVGREIAEASYGSRAPETTLREASTSTVVAAQNKLSTTTSTTTTSTAASASCRDGVVNGGEEAVDCGGPCVDCVVLRLGSGWQKFKDTGYLFRFVGREGVGQSLNYRVEVKTPDGVVDSRPISTGESFVDYLRLRVLNYGEEQPVVSVRINTEDLSAVPPHATLITVGGQSCSTSGAGMCERSYMGYRIRMISRFGSGGEKYASLWVTPPGMAQSKVKVPESGVASADGVLIIGGFFDKGHFIQGGYNLFYVYTV